MILQIKYSKEINLLFETLLTGINLPMNGSTPCNSSNNILLSYNIKQ